MLDVDAAADASDELDGALATTVQYMREDLRMDNRLFDAPIADFDGVETRHIGAFHSNNVDCPCAVAMYR